MKRKMSFELDLNEKQINKIEALAEKRSEEFKATLLATIYNSINRIPRKLKYKDMPIGDLDVSESGLSEEGYPYVKLSNGRIFFDHPSNYRGINLYYLYADITPKAIRPFTYSVGMSIKKRYQINARYMPLDSKVVIEAGAYVGYKAIGYADNMAEDGKVIAIELAPENFYLLQKNVSENQLQNKIEAINAGVWKENGEIPYCGSSHMKYSINQMQGRDYAMRGIMPALTLDRIIKERRIATVDYLNIQVNGTEPEALQGLTECFDNVKVIRLLCSTAINNENALLVADYLRNKGCKVVAQGEVGSVVAVTPSYIGKVQFSKDINK